jgi:hypothetical protein
MLSKCANPACSERFRYLRQGRIFNLEVRVASSRSDKEDSHKVEYFWLCDHCAAAMEVVCENGLIITRPLHSPASRKSRPQGFAAGAGS